MAQETHWPFGEDHGVKGRGSQLPHQDESEKARLAKQAALTQRMRHDRLIVGGRAHSKKQGLS